MLKLIFAQTAPAGTYPPYVNFSGIVGNEHEDGIRVSLRDEPIIEHTENGNHYTAGHTATVVITKEQALELARSLQDHYADSENTESLDSQVERLANFIMRHVPGEPSQNQGAVDTAIRLLRKYVDLLQILDDLNKKLYVHRTPPRVGSIALIADGLRKGQAEAPVAGEDAAHTLSNGFVNAGTTAVALDEFEHGKPEVDVAHVDGTNEPALHSSVLRPVPRFPDSAGQYDDPQPLNESEQPGRVPHLRDHELGGRDLGDENPDDLIPF